MDRTSGIGGIISTDLKVKVKSLSRVQLCNPMGCSLPGSSIHGIFQARILEWVAIPSPGDLPDPGIEPGLPALQADNISNIYIIGVRSWKQENKVSCECSPETTETKSQCNIFKMLKIYLASQNSISSKYITIRVREAFSKRPDLQILTEGFLLKVSYIRGTFGPLGMEGNVIIGKYLGKYKDHFSLTQIYMAF